MTHKLHCPVIHGGLVLNIKKNELVTHSCCLRNDKNPHPGGDVWTAPHLLPLRQFNKDNEVFPDGCWNCESLEKVGLDSYRTGMVKKFGDKTDYSGPVRIDIMFDISCNIACRICGPDLSTFWQKHLKKTNRTIPITSPKQQDNTEKMVEYLKTLDLSNLREVVFCGGETMLGQSHWRISEVLAEIVPNAKQQLMLQFQTNGTIPLTERNYETLSKFHLVKFLISLDGTDEQFEYLRWPAKWAQVTDNILSMKQEAPTNVMFNIEETVSIFNLFYQNRLNTWAKENFSHNRLGDPVSHTKHIAMGTFDLDYITQEYVDAVISTPDGKFIKPDWKENPTAIRQLLKEIQLEDHHRNEDWAITFPEVAEFYKRYI